MDIMTGAGLLAGIIVIAVMMFMGGDLHMFISEHAMIIIFGGSIAATMIRFPLGVMLHGLPLGAKFAFTMSRLSARDLVEELARNPAAPPLSPGEIVTTGTLTDAMPVRPGETWTSTIAGLDVEGLSLTFD